MMRRGDPLSKNPEGLVARVYAYVAYRVGDSAEADDITSATFERALRYGENFDASRGEPIAWLIGIARREIVESFALPDGGASELLDSAAPGDLAADSIRRIDLQRAVTALDRRDRELIALRYGADLSAKQIGELLEMKTNAVEVALHRALKRLRDRLEEDPAPEPAPEPRLRPSPL